ncbi:MAG: phosphatase PAP2 family protein [Burkholderiales bacterium]|nr:phosphatase PAP2 family protein [Burkholderiales bacterium]
MSAAPSGGLIRLRTITAVALLLLLLGAPVWLGWFEPRLFLTLNHACALLGSSLWAGLSLLGNGWGLLAVSSPLLVLAPRLMWAWLCAAPFASLLSRGIKAWFQSPRPAAVLDAAQFRLLGEPLHLEAFPSGHTVTAFAAATALYLACTDRPGRRPLWLFGLAAAAGLSRIAVGAHWPGDVLAGAAIGLIAGALGHALWLRLNPTWFRPNGLGQWLLALLLAATMYTLWMEVLDFAENRVLQQGLMVVVGVSLLGFARQAWRSREGAMDPRS